MSSVTPRIGSRRPGRYKYDHQTRRLTDFVAFMEKRKAKTITTKLAMEWEALPPDRHASWALRLSDVRGFARHLVDLDPKTEVPPASMLPGWKRASELMDGFWGIRMISVIFSTYDQQCRAPAAWYVVL